MTTCRWQVHLPTKIGANLHLIKLSLINLETILLTLFNKVIIENVRKYVIVVRVSQCQRVSFNCLESDPNRIIRSRMISASLKYSRLEVKSFISNVSFSTNHQLDLYFQVRHLRSGSPKGFIWQVLSKAWTSRRSWRYEIMSLNL